MKSSSFCLYIAVVELAFVTDVRSRCRKLVGEAEKRDEVSRLLPEQSEFRRGRGKARVLEVRATLPRQMCANEAASYLIFGF